MHANENKKSKEDSDWQVVLQSISEKDSSRKRLSKRERKQTKTTQRHEKSAKESIQKMDTSAEVARSFLSVLWQQHDDIYHRFEDEIVEFDESGSLSRLGRTIEDIIEDWERTKGKFDEEVNQLVESVAGYRGPRIL